MPVLNERGELASAECPRYRILPEQAMQSRSLVLLGREVSQRDLSSSGCGKSYPSRGKAFWGLASGGKPSVEGSARN
jgi:hypothetical protein